MKVTHTKKKGQRWTVVLETEEEARNFIHVFGCRARNPYKGHLCNIVEVRSGEFGAEMFLLLLDARMGAV